MASEEPTAESATDDIATLLSSGTFMLFAGLFGSFTVLLEQVIMGRLLSPDVYGTVSIAIALLTLCTTLALVGINQGVPRFMARFDDERDERGVWFSGAAIAGSAAVIVSVVLFATGDRVSVLLFGEQAPRRLLVLFVASVPFVVGLEVAVAGLRGREHTTYRVYTRDLLYKGLRICLLVALLLGGVGVLAAGYAYLASAVVAFVVACLLLDRVLPLVGSFELHTRDVFFFSVPLMISAVVSTVLARTDTLMLGYFLTSADAGVYNAAYPLSRGLPVIVSAFEFVYLPLASRLDAAGSRDELDHLYKLTTKWIFVLAFPVFVCLVVFPSDLLTMVFGPEYARGGPALVILSVGLLTGAAYGRCQDTLSAFGLTTYILGVNVAAALLNVALNLAWIPAFGIVGAASASACSLIALNGLALVVLRHESGITPVSRWTLRTFVVLPVVLLPATYLLSQWIRLTPVTFGPIVLLVGLATVVLLAITGGLQPSDEMLIEFVERRLGIRIPLVRQYIPRPDEPANE